MRLTLSNNVTVQSLPDSFATTLRNRILDAGHPAVDYSPLFFDTAARQLGALVATEHHDFIHDLRRDYVLVAESRFMEATLHYNQSAS